MSHDLLPVGTRPLHPTETLIICVCVAAGQWVRTCGCGLLIAGINETDLHCRYRDHLRNVTESLA